MLAHAKKHESPINHLDIKENVSIFLKEKIKVTVL